MTLTTTRTAAALAADLHPNRRGLPATVARTTAGDFTLGGVSATADRLLVVGHINETVDRARVIGLEPGSRVFAPVDFATGGPMPEVALVRRVVGGPVLSLVPVTWDENTASYRRTHSWSMAGGNFADLGDSRLCDLARTLLDGPWYGAVSIHDRVEVAR